MRALLPTRRWASRRLRALVTSVAIGVLLFETLGPLTPAVVNAQESAAPTALAEGNRAYANGRVVETSPAPITTPDAGGGPAAGDPSVGGEPLFLPYTPPADTLELEAERGEQTRTLSKPDGTFTTEVSDGPINYQDDSGAWQPIDLSLVETADSGYRVAATKGGITIGDKGSLGAIDVNGHQVVLSSPIYGGGVKGDGKDVNKVDFAFPAEIEEPTIWVRPIDIGLEFGATWRSVAETPSIGLHLETGDLTAELAKDGRTIRFLDAKGAFAGRISLPILRELSEDGPPILDKVSVGLFREPVGGYSLTYTIDEKWFVASERQFPITLDPTWCIGEGSSGAGCDDYTNSPNSGDTFVFDADPSSYEVGWTVLRTGYDSRSDDGGSYGKMRTILYFPQVTLPDGAVIYDTDLQATVCCLYGGSSGETVSAYRLTKQLTLNYTWNKFGNAYSTSYAESDTVPASGTMNWDVDQIMNQFYTRRPKGWQPPFGFLLKMDAEGSTHGEVEFRRWNDGTASNRPLLTISYTLPVVGIDFDPRLGETYAPSTMVTAQPTTIPIIVRNKTGSAHDLARCTGPSDTDCWKAGYRWFDARGYRVAAPADEADVTFDLPATIVPGSASAVFPITVTPPGTKGQYTLVLDLVHYKTGPRYWWASDFATPSLYYSRNKKVLTSSSTRWTGSSAIERDEFSINVTEGVGGSNVQTVPVASGGVLGIDLSTRNLSFSSDTGLGFADRLPMGLTYGYNEAVAELCSGYLGILGACGWFTNWDERIVGGSNQTGFDYSYVDPAGTPYMLDTDDSGQIAGGAPVLINRQRVTILDESGGWDGSDADSLPDIRSVPGGGVSPAAFAGSYISRAASDTTTYTNAPDKVSLNTYKRTRFAIRTQSATKAGLCFQIHNVGNSTDYPDRWWCYTLGSSTWSAGNDYRFLTGTSGLSAGWIYRDEDLYNDIRNDGDFGTIFDDYQVVKIRIESAGAGPGWTWVDGFRFEPTETVKVADANISWTTGSGQTSTSPDSVTGSSSIRIAPGTGVNPVCGVANSCWASTEGGMWGFPFANWYWKKVGGTSAAMVLYLHDQRSGAHCNTADCTLTYYAGAAPNFTGGGQYNAVIRISDRMPETWTNVRRNVLEDARQALNLYDDAESGSGDDIKMTGFAPVAIDGSHLLVDRWAYGNLADVGSVDDTHQASQLALPSSAGDTSFTYDFTADYPDRSRHYFNRDGLLVRIRDLDRQTVILDWTYDPNKAGPSAYSVTAIHSPTDGATSGGTTFNRQFTITRGSEGSDATIKFDEDLGAIGSDSSSRAVIFIRGTSATPDLVKVSPARTIPDLNANGTFCDPRTSLGNGCIEFAYAGTHRLQYVIDPRWDGTASGTAGDYRLEVGRSGNDPISIKDQSHGSATLLNVVTFADVSGVLYTRPIWKDAAAAAAGASMAADLSPDGQILTRYVRQTGTPSWTANYKAADYEFDGLARVTTVKTYRCPVATTVITGCTGGEDATMTRQETNSAAKVDNYADPLAGGRVAWRADADQVFASLRDSGGTNADWYRTEYVYDGAGRVIETIEVRQVESSNYADTVKLLPPFGYWRLDETADPLLDSSANARNGAYAGSPSLGGVGALIRDPSNKAPTFDGASQSASITGSVSNSLSGTFTVEAWVRSFDEGATEQTFVGSRGGAYGFDAKLCRSTCTGGEGVRVDVGSGSGWVGQDTVPFEWRAGQWYHVVVVVDATLRRVAVYVDGQTIGGFALGTGTPILMNSTHSLYIGQTGLSTSREWFDGQIDEVAVYGAALQPTDVYARFRSGRAVATVDSTVRRDNEGRPVETAASFLINPGFEQAANAWVLGAGASVDTSQHITGAASLAAGPNPTTQVAQLVPGQTFRLQFETQSSLATAAVHVKVEYWQLDASPAWATLTGGIDTDYTNTSWGGHAYDVTLPFDTDGRVRLSLTETGAGSGWVDDVLLVTSWGLVAYDTASPGSVGFGLPTDRWSLDSCTSGPCSTPTVQTQLQYVANTSNPTYHPAIFPTKTTANYHTTPGSGPDEDVASTSGYDSWGRILVATDPDGVAATTVFASNLTDVFQTKDGLNQVTEMTYDMVGNLLTTKTPLGRITTSTYDGRNQQLTTVGPDGTKSQTDYDSYGRPSASWANYVNGTVESGDGDLTDDFLTVPTYDIFGNTITTKAECGELACTSGLRATSSAKFDLLGNTVSSTTSPNANGTAGADRTTINHFEKTTPPSGTPFAGIRFSRTQASGTQLPMAPSGIPAPFCPGSGAQRCNSVVTVDIGGNAVATTDAYGIVTRASYDIAGKTVRTIANYNDGFPGPGTDEDLTATTVYDLTGNPVETSDTAVPPRHDERTYDALGRLVQVFHFDSAGAEYLRETTAYKPSGRVDRTFDGSAWTRTLYDGAGRAVRTIANYDDTGKAGMTLDGLEGGVGAWQSGSSSFFTTTASSGITTDEDAAGNAYHPGAPQSGHGRLRITTHATNTNDGAWLDITGGSTYQATHIYKASFDLAASAAGLSLTAYLGQDASGGSFGSLAISSTTAWTRYTVSWTAGSSLSSNIRFAIRKAAAGTSEVYLDNLVVWDSSSPQTGIVSSVSAYNADGEITASILPPGDPAAGDPATARPLLTAVAFDAAGRTVTSVVNGSSGAYASAVKTTTGVAAYLPLDERIPDPNPPSGPPQIADRMGGADLDMSGATYLGLSGAIDEARSAARFGGGRLSRATNATSATTNISIEAWLRSDAANPASTVVVAANGTQANGWGIGIDSAGNAAGVAILSSTVTTMSSTQKVNDGRWHHVVLTRGASTWAMTLDGAAKTLSSNTTSPGTPGAGLSVGALADGTRAFTGEVDEVAVYTADISASAAAHFSAGRRTDAVTAMTSRTAFDRLGRPTDSWTPLLMRTRATYDRLGNQLDTTANYVDGTPSDGATVDDDVKSTFAYDVLGELLGYCPAVQVATTCTPSTGSEVKAWHYEYDLMGRQTRTIPPVNTAVTGLTIEETVYEPGGRLAKTCRYTVALPTCGNQNSRHVDFAYDDVGRILTQKTYDRGAGSDTLKFTKTMTWNTDGSPGTVSEGTDTLTYVYDAAGRTSQLKRGATVLTAYTYTPATSTIATRTDGTQGVVAFTYDWARRTTVVDPPDSFVSGTVTRTYRLDGLLATQAFPSSITETLSYDAAKRPTSISLGAAGSLSQAFDRAGNVVSDGRSLAGISGDAGGNTQTFGYDGLSRLLSSSGLASSSGSYEYDLDGNRTKRVEGGITTTYTYDRADEAKDQTITGTTKTSTYDAYGNQTQSADKNNALTTYAYDEASRLTTITPPAGGQITFSIDALDRHKDRTVTGTGITDTYSYLDATETAWQTGIGGSPTGALLDADGSRLAVKTGSAVPAWLLFDLHGSVVGMCTAGTSTITDAYRFDGWGVQVANSGTAVNPWRYRGLLNIGTDPGTTTGALLDMNARDYSPQLGTFTQEDSVAGSAANPASMNRFLYALGNPATLVDPDGHAAVISTDGGGGGYGSTVQRNDGTNCNRSCIDAGKNQVERVPVSVPHSAAPVDETFIWTGYNPWALDADPTYAAYRDNLAANCRHPSDLGCDAVVELADARQRNEDLYCSFHRTECDNDRLHQLYSTLGLVPGLGIPFNGLDAALYTSEGDALGASLAVGAMIPIAGWAAKGGATIAKSARAIHFIDAATLPGIARTIVIDAARFEGAASHLIDACGRDFCVTLDRAGAGARREANFKRFGSSKPGWDRDEAPGAIFRESENASVRFVEPHPNRALGPYIAGQLRGVPDGSIIRILIEGG